MTCQECELRLAGEERDEAVAEHLAACAACKEFASDLQANLQALYSLRTEPMPRLRKQPAARGFARPTNRKWVAIAAAAIAAAVLMMMAIPDRGGRSPERITVIARTTETHTRSLTHESPRSVEERSSTVVKDSQARSGSGVRVSAVRPRPHRAVRQGEPKILQVKMLTDDPNVVIYWQVETHNNQGSKGTE